jgi:protein involved in polysaccharide export with SLBB domain
VGFKSVRVLPLAILAVAAFTSTSCTVVKGKNNAKTAPTRQEQQIRVSGEVNKPGNYAYTEQLSIERAVTLAGGLTKCGVLNRLFIYRTIDRTLTRLEATAESVLQPDDQVVIPCRFF